MTDQEILNLIVSRNYEEVENLLKNGFDVNKPVDNGTLEFNTTGIEWSSYGNDIKMMEIFWKYGAKTENEFVNEIIAEFENGKTYLDFEKDEENIEDFTDLTHFFSVTKLDFYDCSIVKDEEDNQYTMFLPISKFVLDNKIVDTSIRLDFIALPENLESCIGKTLNFPINPAEGYIDGSVYIRNAHNPVDVTEIKFLNIENDKLTAEITMTFDFEFEATGFKNEKIVKKVILEIS
ncbi:hypothetical protein ACFX5D_16210 [Flavobacterium sp. LB3P45]|uniref:Ankyrin repeat-containing protein n=1 Tax=Flavobacterium fructosi TaxID=3230416 RepID=A0ABW6HRT5_9FLAO